MTQKFKGDDTELKMEAAARTAFDVCSVSLDEFNAGAFSAADFLLMLYDEGRAPFSDRVPRDSFVEFMREAIGSFQFTGTFDNYLFIIEAVFGEGSTVLFDVPDPGKIEMLVNASSSYEFTLQVRSFVDGAYQVFDLVDQDGNNIAGSGISGIDSEYKLNLLLSELTPAGISPDVTLAFYSLYNFINSDGDSIVDHLDNQLVFIEP